uniref:Uncharacterized protein n=1 Tax=Timema shepardi TaxID=629360 RepID=A0A7R9FZC6_TIMSH|nr:unnamed protein product [Timema shepardi]
MRSLNTLNGLDSKTQYERDWGRNIDLIYQRRIFSLGGNHCVQCDQMPLAQGRTRTPKITPDQDLNPAFPVIGSLVYCESDATDMRPPIHLTEIRASISPFSVDELNTTSALANYATELFVGDFESPHRTVRVKTSIHRDLKKDDKKLRLAKLIQNLIKFSPDQRKAPGHNFTRLKRVVVIS